MLAFYILGLPDDADEEAVRRRYLELVRRHPPEKDPELFQRITAAYEAVRTRKQRVREILFQDALSIPVKERLRIMAEPSVLERRRLGLAELVQTLKSPNGGR